MAGKVYIIKRQSDGTWIKASAIDAPAGSARFGASVLLGSSSDLLFVGAPGSAGGQVITYVASGTSWSLQRTLVPPDPDVYTYFGESLAYDGYFNLLVGRRSGFGLGSAYLFSYRPTIGTWTFRQKLLPANTGGSDCGKSVAIAGTAAFLG